MECSCPHESLSSKSPLKDPISHLSFIRAHSLYSSFNCPPPQSHYILSPGLFSLNLNMALPAILVSMITVRNTAAGIIGTIKRRCGASQAIVELTSTCTELVVKIRKLLMTLESSAEVPHDTRAISTALKTILKNLDKMNQCTKRTHPVDRTEKFVLAQG